MSWYCTREQVKAALDVAETARADTQIDRLIEASSRGIEAASRANREFRPYLGTELFDWPAREQGGPTRLWIDRRAELITPTAIVSAGTTIDLSAVRLYPRQGPPYGRVELDRSVGVQWGYGGTSQASVSITGWWGYRDDEAPAGELVASVDATSRRVDVTDSAAVGVGDLIRVGDERMQVVGKRMLDTGQTLQGPVPGTKAETQLAVDDGDAFAVGETILVDAERMLIVDIAGDSLIARRAWDGSVLAGHAAAAPVYAARTLTVDRGQAGTTAAVHSAASPVLRHEVPGPIEELCIAETLVALGREQAGYARTVGAGDAVRAAPGGDIRDLRETVRSRYRRYRSGAI